MVGGAHHKDALGGAEAGELGEQLVDHVASGAAPERAALLADGVELVEEENAGSVPARRLEDVVQPALTLAKPEVEYVLETDDQEPRNQLARPGASKEGRAAARRPVEQETAP